MRSSQTPSDKIQARHTAGLEITSALDNSAKQSGYYDRIELHALATRIRYCTDRSNAFIATDAVNFKTGELYDQLGTFWKCGSKLCPNCIADQARRSRKKLREAMNKQSFSKGERLLFVTLTIKNPNVGLRSTRDLVNRAWQLFRKRKMCVDLVAGGVKSEEFTLTANGYHYHLHLIIKCKYFQYNEFRRVWTECVAIAFGEARLAFSVNTKDGLLIVNFKPLTDQEKSIQEVCKYITKSDSWSKMRSQDLTEVALIKRWHRMFELFGTFASREAEGDYVHTRDLSDGTSNNTATYWRDKVLQIGIEQYIDELNDEVSRCREARIHQILYEQRHCTLTDGAGTVLS